MEQLVFEKLAAIFPLNELYFLAQQELNMRASKTGIFQDFPITRLLSRKVQQDGENNTVDWPGREKILPWEEAAYSTVLNYRINYDAQNSNHKDWNLQETSARGRLRKVKFIFVDQLILTIKAPTLERARFFKGDTDKAVTEFTFECTPIPQKSMDTMREVRGLVTAFSETYHLYPNASQMSKRDKRLFGRIYVHPSCLELKKIVHTGNSRIIQMRDKTEQILDATDHENQLVLWKLSKATAYQIMVPHKKYDKVDGFIFDGVVSPHTIEAMLGKGTA